jgi:hypothetical protein
VLVGHPVAVPSHGKRPETGVSARAEHLADLDRELRRAYQARDGSAARDEIWAKAARAFNEGCRSFYEPYEGVVAGVRKGRADAIDEAVRFLVADPWCFRSGYLKADLMHALANTALPAHAVNPLRDVVVRRITQPQPRLLRYAAQLAANLWSDSFERELQRLRAEGSPADQAAARSVIDGARHRLRSLAGSRHVVAEAAPLDDR